MVKYFFAKPGPYRPSRSGYDGHLCNKTEIKRSVRTEFSLKIGDPTLSARPIPPSESHTTPSWLSEH